MQITLNEKEISEAVENYVRQQIKIADNQNITIDYTAGRGTTGLSAALEIRMNTTAAKPTTTYREPVSSRSEAKPVRAPREVVASNVVDTKDVDTSDPEANQEEPDSDQDTGAEETGKIDVAESTEETEVSETQKEEEEPAKPLSKFSKSAKVEENPVEEPVEEPKRTAIFGKKRAG